MTQSHPDPTVRSGTAYRFGLFLCEAVSDARFASVWGVTDLLGFRARIAILMRDEIAHARLGAALLPQVYPWLCKETGTASARAAIRADLNAAISELTRTVARGVARDNLPCKRGQPTNNPGIVEPSLDAHAFYRALDTRVLPGLNQLKS